MSQLRKTHIADMLSQLIQDYPEYDVSMLLKAVLRRKNYRNGKSQDSVFFMDATDEQISLALERTLNDLKISTNGRH